MSDTRPAEHPSDGARAFAVVTALFLGGCLAAGYGFATADGRWPVGHPWSALTLSSMGLVLVVWSAAQPRQVQPLRALIALSLASAVAWLVATALVG